MLCGVRVSLSPGPGLPELDLELAAGVTLDSLRPLLADASGCPAARTAPLAVGGLVLDESHRTGTFPLVAGARLRVGHTEMSDDGDLAAVRARWHAAVVVGPDAGRLWPVTGRVHVGRAGGRRHDDAPARAARWELSDPRVSQSHLEVRCTGGRVWVRDVGSANGARRTRAWARHRLGGGVPRWWTRWRPGDRIRLGATVLELRASAPAASSSATPSSAATSSASSPRGRTPRAAGRATLAATALLPALGSLALVAGTGNPALLALGLAGPALAGILSSLRPSPAGSSAPDQGVDPTTAVDACELAAAVARAVLTGEPSVPGPQLTALAPGGVLAVCGPGAREAAATLVLANEPAGVEVVGPGGPAWAWARWLDGGRAAAGDETGPRAVVVDGAEPLPEWGGPGRVVVLVDPERVPSWCTARLDAATGTWDGPDGVRVQVVRAGSAAWAENQARRLAGVRSVRALGAGGLPEAVTLGALGLPMSAPGILGAWASADAGLRVLAGAGPEGRDAEVDLAREGPHALVAGTTGSGKSELLRAIITSLALRYPPTALAFALVDFKGGAGFGALAGLPHVVGTVTDLDAHEAARALGGLAAELRRRKALLAHEGVADLRDWPAGSPVPHPGRLVVVIDEFRALAESLPDLMGALERIATQGRSLGVHLVLATQRPSGVVSAELRANVALRFALRVTDVGDSSDVIEVPDAAHIPPALPGRALLRRGPGPVEELQVAQVGLGAPPVRRVHPVTPPTSTAETGTPNHHPGNPTSAEPGSLAQVLAQETDFDTRLVAAVREAAAGWQPHAQRPGAPWLPALPTELQLDDLPRWATPASRDDGLLPFGLADVPEHQRRAVAAWDPGTGHLLALGGPASGRSTLLATLGAAALARGWTVHAVGLPAHAWPPDGRGSETGQAVPPGRGTVCGPEDPRRLARLVTLLRDAPPRTLLLVDDAAEAWRALERVARGAGAERFAELLRSRSVAVAATAARATGPWAAHLSERLVLPVGDAVAEEMAGVPRHLSGARRGPGRAVWLPARDEPLVCQVALASDAADGPSHTPGAPGVPHTPTTEPALRLAPIPLVVPRPASAPARRRGLAVGVGGDTARIVTIPADGGALVVGPPGSGRSTAIAQLVRAAATTHRCVTLARDASVLDAAAGAGPAAGFDREVALSLLEGMQMSDDDARGLVVVDDLDHLVRLVPDAADLLDVFVDGGGRLVAGLTLDAALGSYRGAVATLRARRVGLVLAAHAPGSSEVFGTPLDWDADPAHPHHPGRGVVQHGARVTPVQVFAPEQHAPPISPRAPARARVRAREVTP